MPGVVNDPSNRSLRAEILKCGTGRMCTEMRKRSMPLRLNAEDPAIGRFFATQCQHRDTGGGELWVQFTGFGYVWTNLTGRITFEASGTIQYDTDFLMDGSTMYVYFRQRQTSAANFVTRTVERQPASIISALPFGSGGQGLGTEVGSQILKSEMAKGFTVVRKSDGATSFGFGIVDKGKQEDLAPFRVTSSGNPILANDRSELHAEPRDFVGPLTDPDGAKLIINVAGDGAPAIDVLLFPRVTAEQWLQQYAVTPQPGPPPAMPLLDEAVPAGVVFKRTLSVQAGSYYLVLDNTSTAGAAAARAPPCAARRAQARAPPRARSAAAAAAEADDTDQDRRG